MDISKLGYVIKWKFNVGQCKPKQSFAKMAAHQYDNKVNSSYSYLYTTTVFYLVLV